MKRAALGLSLLLPALAFAGETMYDGTFTAKVLSVKMGRDPKAISVDIDARYLVEVKVESLVGDAPFAEGAIQKFAIHSPSRFFRGDAPVGKKVTLRLTGPQPYWHLELQR